MVDYQGMKDPNYVVSIVQGGTRFINGTFIKLHRLSNNLTHGTGFNGQNKMYGVKAWLGYPKGLSHFTFTGSPHLNMLLKLNDTFILKV